MKDKKDNEPIIFIIDDDLNIRQALQWLFESVCMKVETYENAINFLEIYNPNAHGCIVADIRMSGMSGLELLEQLKLRRNHLPVILITGHGDIPMAVRAMKAGALDFISKPFNDQYLLEQVQKALAQARQPFNQKSLNIIIERYDSLTVREREIMKMVTVGKLNKQIGHELNIAISTVELHRSHVMQKMQAKSVAELVKLSIWLET